MKNLGRVVVGFVLLVSFGAPGGLMQVGPQALAAPGHAMVTAKVCSSGRQVGQVQKVSQGLEVKHPHKKKWNSVQAKTPLYRGDMLETKKGERAAITDCAGGTLYMNQGTNVQLQSRNGIEVKRGEVAESLKGKASHDAKAPDAVARGINTRFGVKIEKHRSRFIVASGSVQVRNKRGTVRVGKDQQTIVRTNSAPAKPMPVDAQAALSWTTSLAGPVWQVLTVPGVLQGPVRLALDSQGNIYVTDLGISDRRVVKLSPTGKQLAVWKLQGSVPEPWGITVDAQNTIYVTSNVEGNVQKFTSSGQFLAEFGKLGEQPGELFLPNGVKVDSAGNIYIAEAGSLPIQELSATGQPLAQFGTKGSGPGQFDNANDLALDAAGNMYVADWGNNRIQKLSPSGQPLAAWGSEGTAPGQFKLPTDVALDAKGNIYVADSANGRIQELSPTGRPLQSFGTGGLTKPGELNGPFGVALDAKGNIYVADHYNGRVQKLTRG